MLIIVAAVSVGLIFVFDASYKVHPSTLPQILYWGSKGFSFLTLLFVGIFIYKKIEIANTLILVRLTIVWQFIPLIMRFLLSENKDPIKVVLPTIILVIALLGYIAIYFLLIESSRRIKEKLPELKGEIKPVLDSKSYCDENNNFIGANVRSEEEDE